MAKQHVVFVDGLRKGEVFYKNRRWWWRRTSGTVEPMPPRSTLDDLTEWVRKCCLGNRARISR